MILRRFERFASLYLWYILYNGVIGVYGLPYMILSSTRSKCFSVIAPHGQTITIEYDAPGKQAASTNYILYYWIVDRIRIRIRMNVMHITLFILGLLCWIVLCIPSLWKKKKTYRYVLHYIKIASHYKLWTELTINARVFLSFFDMSDAWLIYIISIQTDSGI